MEEPKPKMYLDAPEGYKFKESLGLPPTTESLVDKFLTENPNQPVLMISLHRPDGKKQYMDLHLRSEDLMLTPDQFMRRFMEPTIHCLLNWHRDTPGANASAPGDGDHNRLW